MGFWSKLLGEKKRAKKEIALEDMPEFAEKNAAKSRENAERAIANSFSQIKHIIGEARQEIKQIKQSSVDGGNVRLKKIVGTSKEQAVSKLSTLFDKIAPPASIDAASAKKYTERARNEITKEVSRGGKSIAYTGIYLKENMKKMGKLFKELNEELKQLGEILEHSESVFAETRIKELAKEINESRAKIAESEKAKADSKKALEKVGAEEKSLAKKLAELRESDKFRELDLLEEKKAELANSRQGKKTELVSLISAIDKPLKRFLGAVSSKRIIIRAELKQALEQLERNPLQLLKKDPKGELIKELLQELKSAVESGAVELKEKEREKKIAAINELLAFNFFSKVFWEFNEIDAAINAIDREIHANKAVAEANALEKIILGKEREREPIGKAAERGNSLLKERDKELSEFLNESENLLSKISGQEVKIKLS